MRGSRGFRYSDAADAARTTKPLTDFPDKNPSKTRSEGIHSLAGWLTLTAILVIFGATLFPFDFSVSETASRRVGFFLFWLAPVAKNWVGWLLNIILFLPFGFGLTWWARVRGRRLFSGWISVGVAGVIFSYTVEFLQLFVPGRNSSWDDVVMNTAGAVAGFLLFERWGAWLLSLVESALTDLSASFER